MNTFPLKRILWSNEHIMAALLGVLLLYMLPGWVNDLSGIFYFLIICAVAIFVDMAVNMFRYRQPVCAVSAAVTAGIVYVLTPGSSLGLQLAGTAAALILGKHIWGGTGKNPINPAMTGVLLIGLLTDLGAADISPRLLLIPALLLSIPFIRFRPYASIGFMTGMAAALVLLQKFGFDSYLGYGAIFWGCLIITDPVTVSFNPKVGAVGGALVGLAAIVLSGSTVVLAAGILLFNVICFIADKYLEQTYIKNPGRKAVGRLIKDNSDKLYFDLSMTGDETTVVSLSDSVDCESMLKRVEANEVVGLGGAAFPAGRKIRTVAGSHAEKKYLIVNGVECDPGLIHDKWLINRHMKEICKGVSYIRECIDFELITIAVKEGTEIKDCEVNVVTVPDYYPIGAEKNLIRHILGVSLSEGDIPAENGILVLNVQTVFSIYEAVYHNKKADTKLITVADLKAGVDYVVRVRLGTGIRALLQMLPISSGNIFIGGGAMQCRTTTDEDVIDGNANFIGISDFPKYKESVLCSKCGLCVESCPQGLRVDAISKLVDQGNLQSAKKYQPEKCIQCGNCSRVCLAGRNLAMRVKAAKLYEC